MSTRRCSALGPNEAIGANELPKKKSTPTPHREPNQRELQMIEEAGARYSARPRRPELVWVEGQLDAAHSDAMGQYRAIADTLGTASMEFLSAQLGVLEYVSRGRGEASGKSATTLNASIALVAAIKPESELEAALAVQMAGVNSLACEMLGRAKQTDRADLIALYGGLAVKLTRTFAAQMDVLAKLRGGGKQTVEVKHVYVNGSAVVGDVHLEGRGD